MLKKLSLGREVFMGDEEKMSALMMKSECVEGV